MTYDAIILGLGAMGSSAAMRMTRVGKRVLGLEQFGVAHHRGSSHGRSRMIRMAYYEHPDYVPLLRRAYELWDELSSLAEEPLLFRTGGLYLGPPECEVIAGARRSAAEHLLPIEVLDRRAVERRFPQFRPDEGMIGVFEPSAGFLLPERVIAANLRLAESAGATIKTGERVIDWRARSDGVEVITDRAAYEGKCLILAAGAWMADLCRLPMLASRLHVTRQASAWFQPLRNDLSIGTMPVWGIDHPSGGLLYGFPVHPADDGGLKAALHLPGPEADPDSLDRSEHPHDIDLIRATLDRHLPNAAGTLARHCVCMYTNTPDGHFILDRHPDHANVFLASCCSGHGFKFASVIGEVLADLACGSGSNAPIGFLSMGRFAG
jgi:sarcosine oxidase